MMSDRVDVWVIFSRGVREVVALRARGMVQARKEPVLRVRCWPREVWVFVRIA